MQQILTAADHIAVSGKQLMSHTRCYSLMKMQLFQMVLVGCQFALSSQALAAIVVTFDLTTTDEVTISATDATSSGTVSGSDSIGVYFENFYNGTAFAGGGVSGNGITLAGGDFVYFSLTADNTPLTFRGGPSPLDPGFNLWSLADFGAASFTAGQQAFKGSATGTVDSVLYGELFALGNRSGNVFAFADDVSDIPAATLIGEYNIKTQETAAVPEPSSLTLTLGLAVCLAIAQRPQRRKRN